MRFMMASPVHPLPPAEAVPCCTVGTRGSREARAFAARPGGAALVGVGRGPLVVEADLLAALETGRLGAATLDVFQTEPLPPESPFWDHPRVVLTPHVASLTIAKTASAFVIDSIRRHRAGQPLLHLVDFEKGY